ncbi:MAG TPA: hypothetical protein VI755_14500 [Anaerolineales bacterium]|nr:hypothetical protein [Anaerolineales bacterium]
MKSKLIFASIFRTIARILSILMILLGIPFLLFAGLQLLSGEPGNLAVFLYLLLLVGMLAGLVIAWRREGLGAAITLVSLVGSFALSGANLPGVGRGQGFSLLASPINLIFALLIPGYHPEASPSAKLVPIISWVLATVPVVLFIASWWLRKPVESKFPEDVSTTGKVG